MSRNMNQENFIARKVSGWAQWFRIYRLYCSAFPKYEKKPFGIIRSMWKKGKTDVWYFENNGRFSGFATTINGDDLILLDYLAVARSARGQGVGSRALRELKKHYAGKGIFVEIESVYESAANHAERVRRREFYMKNGMCSSEVVACVYGVNMELLCWNCGMDFATYQAFYRDNYSPKVAKHLNETDIKIGASL